MTMLETRRQQEQENKDFGLRCAVTSSIRAVSEDENDRRFIVSFSSEEPYERWFGLEILDHSEDAVDLNRLNTIGVLLFNHDTDRVCGKILRAWIENARGYAEVEFDDDDDADLICKKVRSGTLKATSVWYKVTTWEDVAAGKKSTDGKYTGPCSIARKWMPYEVSIVSVPADATVGVGRSHGTNDAANTNEAKSGRSIRELQLLLNKLL